jgi:hypothetical protein
MAMKLNMSLRAWHNLRDELIEDLKFPIAYCPIQKTYYYTLSGKFQVGFKCLSDEKKENLRGGMAYSRISYNNFCHSAFSLHYLPFTL